jgi:EAL domain-containing protein (putative c-di-GMP-specific phosphodiesterase class I)
MVELESRRVVGFEALVRWAHPGRGLVPPLHFIPTAEASGLIVPLGRWVLAEACRAAVGWSDQHPAHGPLQIAVNLSVRQLQDPGVVADVTAALAASGLDPERLVLEITESVLMHDVEQAMERLGALKALGVRLAVDDFGTGYSSLSYLRRFPFDTVKIDKSLC